MSAYSALVLSHGSLIGYWRLGDSIGNPLDDAGPNGLDGNYAASGLTYGVAGAIANDADTAVTGDGSTDFASVPGNALLDLADGPFTYELWLKRSATQGAIQTLLAKGSGAASFRFAANNKIEVIKQGTAGAIATSASALTDTTAWHHVVLTKNGAATKIYIDGADVTVAGTNQTLANNSPTALRIGAFSATLQFFPGSLDEVAVYGAVLTPTEVLQHYQVGRALVGTATETDSAVALDKDKHSTLVVGTETDTAQALSYAKPIYKTLTSAAESDSAQGLTAHKAVGVTAADETDSSEALGYVKPIVKTLTPAGETDSAQTLVRQGFILSATETDEAQALSYQVATPPAPQRGGFRVVPKPPPRRPQRVSILAAWEMDIAQQLEFTKTPSAIQLEDDELLLLV